MHCKCYIMPCSRACLWICRFQSFSMTFLQFPTHNAWQATPVPKCTLAPFRTFPKPQGEAAPGQAGAVMEGLEAFGPGDQFSAAGVVVWGMNWFYKRAHIHPKTRIWAPTKVDPLAGKWFPLERNRWLLRAVSAMNTNQHKEATRAWPNSYIAYVKRNTCHTMDCTVCTSTYCNFPNSPLLQHLKLSKKHLSSLQN